MAYKLDHEEFDKMVTACEDVVVDLPSEILAIEDAVASLATALAGTDCAGPVESCGSDVLLPDARYTMVRCENAVAGAWGMSRAVKQGNDDMADDAREKIA